MAERAAPTQEQERIMAYVHPELEWPKVDPPPTVATVYLRRLEGIEDPSWLELWPRSECDVVASVSPRTAILRPC